MKTAITETAVMGATLANGGINPVTGDRRLLAATDKAGNSVRARAAITQIAHTRELGLFNTERRD